MTALPAPSQEALAHSERVVELIRGEIEWTGGWISFARYMDLALYAPGLGYYAAGTAKLGGAGDFVTAPEMTPLFGRTLARTAREVLAQTGGEILELGAGSGRLARDMLLELERLRVLPERYLILETSPDLRARQHDLFARDTPHLLPRLAWLDSLPDHFTGVVLGNEVLDALPVHMVHWRADGTMERGVAWREGDLAWEDRAIRSDALDEAAAGLSMPDGYLSEINLAAPALVASLARCLERGMLLFIDYGFPRAEYYHPQRDMGTLRVHYRHHSLDDPFFLPGLADITAHVDFSAVARAGEAAGLELLGYDSQARFLLHSGLLDLMQEIDAGSVDYLRMAAPVQKLLQPSEMGELFKVIALGRGVAPPTGLRGRDRAGAL